MPEHRSLRKMQILASLTSGFGIEDSCVAASVPEALFTHYCKSDPKFRRACKALIEMHEDWALNWEEMRA